MESEIRVLDLFSGIGGFSLGLERAGPFRTVAFCERDKFCQAVLRKHWPNVPIYDDVRALNFGGGLMSSQAATRASATVEPTHDVTVAVCGLGHCDRSSDTDLFTLFEKMFLETSTREPLNRLKVTLSQKVMPSGLTLSVLRPSVPLTIDPGRGRWPTPTAQDAKNATMPPSQAHRNNGSIPCLLARMGFVGWVLNPRFYEELMMYPAGWTELEVWEMPSSRKSSSK